MKGSLAAIGITFLAACSAAPSSNGGAPAGDDGGGDDGGSAGDDGGAPAANDGGAPAAMGSPKASWAHPFGDGTIEDATAVAVDKTGNVILVGYFQGTVDFGGGPLVAVSNSNDMFVAKFDATGRHLWSHRYGDASSQVAFGVAVDASGAVIVTGYFGGTLDFGGGHALVGKGLEDMFVAKLDPNGTTSWAHGYGDPQDQCGYAVAVGADGSIVVGGYTHGTVDYGRGPVTSAGGADALVMKLDASGATLWAHAYGDASDQFAIGVAVGPAGDVGVSGLFAGSIDLGKGVMTSAGKKDAFVARLDATGAAKIAARYGDADDQLANAIAFTGDGDMVVAGSFVSTIDFGLGALHGPGGGGGGGGGDGGGGGGRGLASKFVVKLDGAGKALWNHAFGSGELLSDSSLAVDPKGNVIVVGDFLDKLGFGNGSPMLSSGAYDAYLVKLSPAGVPIWGAPYGDYEDQVGRAAATDADGNVVMCGYFKSSIDFGLGTKAYAHGDQGDLFLARFAP